MKLKLIRLHDGATIEASDNEVAASITLEWNRMSGHVQVSWGRDADWLAIPESAIAEMEFVNQ
jgi:hypothetical protein